MSTAPAFVNAPATKPTHAYINQRGATAELNRRIAAKLGADFGTQAKTAADYRNEQEGMLYSGQWANARNAWQQRVPRTTNRAEYRLLEIAESNAQMTEGGY